MRFVLALCIVAGCALCGRSMAGSARRRYEMLQELLRGIEPGSTVTLGVRAEELSQMIGQKRENISALCQALSLADLKVRSCAAEKGEIVILSVEKSGKV